MLRLNKATTGHRLLRGAVTIGGARLTALPDLDVVATVAREVEELRAASTTPSRSPLARSSSIRSSTSAGRAYRNGSGTGHPSYNTNLRI
jgi:Ni,Fe-hydrogenase III large subunit